MDPARLHAAQSRIREALAGGLTPDPFDLHICLFSQDAAILDTLLMAALDQTGRLRAENAVLRTALETVLKEAGTRLRVYHPTLVERVEGVLRTAPEGGVLGAAQSPPSSLGGPSWTTT